MYSKLLKYIRLKARPAAAAAASTVQITLIITYLNLYARNSAVGRACIYARAGMNACESGTYYEAATRYTHAPAEFMGDVVSLARYAPRACAHAHTRVRGCTRAAEERLVGSLGSR